MVRIGFGTNKKTASRIIRSITDSRWSHTWIEYQSTTWGGMWAAHSSDRGVVKVPLYRVYEAYPVKKLYTCFEDLRGGFVSAADYIGYKYDYGVIWNGLMLALYKMTKFELLWNFVVRNSSKLSCSEFVCKFLKDGGIPGLKNYDPEYTTPGDLEKFCSESELFKPIKLAKRKVSK